MLGPIPLLIQSKPVLGRSQQLLSSVVLFAVVVVTVVVHAVGRFFLYFSLISGKQNEL